MLPLPLIVSPSGKASFAASRQERFFMRVALLRRNSGAKSACSLFFPTLENAISVSSGFLTRRVGPTANDGSRLHHRSKAGRIPFSVSFARLAGLVRRLTKPRAAGEMLFRCQSE